MIKEKHDKGSESGPVAIKEEASTPDAVLNKELEPSETRIKTEEEPATSSCGGGINKDCNRNNTKNGATNVIGSTNTGSLHGLGNKESRLLETPGDEAAKMEDPSLLTLKTEEGLESTELPQDTFSGLAMPGAVAGSAPPHPPPPDGVQPLASNVINKQASNMEVQYMQQQSQIFVFSTMLANKGADAVLQGHFPSIIAYHCAQPGTRKYLEKNPLKIAQFNRQNPAQWLNNLTMIKNKGCTRSPGMMGKGPTSIDGFIGADNLEDMVGLSEADLPWEQKNSHHMGNLDAINNGAPVLNEVPHEGAPMDPCLIRSSPGGTGPSLALGHSPIMTNANSSSPLANMQPSLAGVKVPDENLTPQQRQHREEQLATIRKMQQMLFPEHQMMGVSENAHPSDQQENIPGPIDMPPGGEICGETGNMRDGNIPPGPGMMGGMVPGMVPQRHQGMMQGPPPGSNLNAPTSVSAQIEWQKLQHQYFEERKIKCVDMPPTGPPGANAPVRGTLLPRAGPVPGPRLQGPPPPYHQTQRSASVPVALPSPNPASPNNPTSNLSLPSPRASSALNSPADPNRPFGITRHLSTGQSPTSQDSPATARGLNPSNPGTPVASHLSPNANLIVSSAADFPPASSTVATSHPSSDGMFGRTLQSLAQQKQSLSTGTSTVPTSSSKEPNLMPVPSPQQIQYLNTFEGQELTIQKQPNTSLKDGNMISPSMLPTTMESGFSGSNSDLTSSRVSGPNTPMTPTSMDVSTRFPSTPGISSEGCRFQISSPQMSNNSNTVPTSAGEKPQRLSGSSGLSPPGSRTPNSSSEPLKTPQEMTPQFPAPSPHGLMDVHRFPGPGVGPNIGSSGSPGPFPPQQQNKIVGFMNVSPSNKGPPMDLPVPNSYACTRDNVPLNPNSTTGMTGNPKVSHFDPISSLAQMSQQLTNSVASSLNGQSNPSSGMMNFSSPGMHMMDMGGCHGLNDLDGGGPGSCNILGMPMQPSSHPSLGYHPNAAANSPMGAIRSISPKLPNPGSGPFPGSMPMPRMMGRPPVSNPYNGASVQVKPSAPNTIQYLPAKPQVGNTNPRGPPSLDFLHRFANPLSNLDSKMPTQNLQYFPSGSPMGGGSVTHMGHMDGPMGGDGPMGSMMNGPMGGSSLGNNPMVGPGMGMGGPGPLMNQNTMGLNMPLMRNPGMRPPGMIRMQQMNFNGPGAGGPPGEPMFSPGPNMPSTNTQIFVAGPKGSPMTLGAPDASQPLPPSMGQGNAFKNSPFVGPTTADPNYAQQFHNFQQQLYATNTRSQMSNQAMGPGPGPGPPHSASQSYFVPK